jgi:hypothetical protein
MKFPIKIWLIDKNEGLREELLLNNWNDVPEGYIPEEEEDRIEYQDYSWFNKDLKKFPIIIKLQWTRKRALSKMEDNYDEDSEDEESIPALDIEIGRSTDSFELNSWDDVPEGYEPVDEKYLREYKEYLENKDMEKQYPGINL